MISMRIIGSHSRESANLSACPPYSRAGRKLAGMIPKRFETSVFAGMTVESAGKKRGRAGITERGPEMSWKSTGGSARGGRTQGGFTLFEMLIAVSIFAVMGVIAFGGLSQMTRTGQAVVDANDRLSDLQFAVVYFNRDWTQVSPRNIRNQYGDEESNLIIEDGQITFTRSGWSNLLGQRRSSLQRVQYQVVDEQLVRRHWRTLDQGIGEQPLQVVLLDDVKSMEVEMLDAKGQAITDWPQEASRTEAPIVLAFRLELSDMGEITRLLEIPGGAL